MIEQELGSLKQALTAFNKAIEVEPELEDIYLERANLLCELIVMKKLSKITRKFGPR